jgi:hypothetical protein
LNAGTLSGAETELVAYVSRYVAWAAYLEALDYLVVWATPKGLRVLSEFDGINNKKTPEASDVALLKLSVERKCESYRGALLGFMGDNLTEFPLLADGGQVPVKGKPNFLKVYDRVVQM